MEGKRMKCAVIIWGNAVVSNAVVSKPRFLGRFTSYAEGS
jgi:hypothetical protein